MFKPQGEQPQWQLVYERLSAMSVGEEITDEELQKVLPDAPEGSIRSAFFRAVQQVEDDMHRTFARVRLTGYRMVEAKEHETLARNQHKRAKRRLRAAGRKIHSADRSLLTPDERRRFDALEDHLARQHEMIRRLEDRQARTEQDIKTLRRNTKADLAAVTEQAAAAARSAVEELLHRHGIGTAAKV